MLAPQNRGRFVSFLFFNSAFGSTGTGLQPFQRQMEHFLTDMSNRVELQKRNQLAIEKWPFGFILGVQLSLLQARALIKTKKNKLLQVEQLWDK